MSYKQWEYGKATVTSNTTFMPTGSDGVSNCAGFIITGSTIAGTVELQGGGTIQVNGLTAGTLYPFGVRKCISSNATTHIITLYR